MQKYFALLAIILSLPIQVMAFVVPEKPVGFVSDYANILSVEQKNSLENKIFQFEKQSTNEISVVTIDSLDGDSIENVAQEIFTRWGIGKEDKDNGVLLLVAVEDRKTRIHTGYGVEGDLTDIGTSYIQSEVIVPAFRDGDYFSGINGAVDKMIESLGGTEIVPDDYSEGKSKNNSGVWEMAFFFIFMILQISISVLARSKSWWAGGILGAVISAIVIFWTGLVVVSLLSGFIFIIFVGLGLLIDYSVSKAYTAGKFKNGPGGFWWLGGGGFGGGSGGGGFGGFGGGSSGGGGSSSSW